MHTPNPFTQYAALWRVTLEVPAAAVAFCEDAFADALALSSFEVDDPAHMASPARWDEDLPVAERWKVEALFPARPDRAWIAGIVGVLETLGLGGIGAAEVHEVERTDWIAAMLASHPPLIAGRFRVAGSHIAEPVPHGLIPLTVDAGLAFGSGEHATTRGCLMALTWLARTRRFTRMLDVGCGSGILACAMAKLWRAPVLATDIDAVSVRVTQGTVEANGVGRWVRTAQSDGYHAREVREGGPYDLIVANILARPLMRMSKDLAAHLAPGGMAVLSGLLGSQERMVLNAHRLHGLRLKKRLAIGEWRALIIEP